VRAVDHPHQLAPRLRKSRAVLLILLFAFMTWYRVKFIFTFTFDYDYHTFGSVSEGTVHMWHVK